ncbi:MAG: glycosyltransferase family 1 protein, partial [Chloroflexi bacterium]
PIVSNCSSLPEVVGDVGLLIDPNEPQTITDALYKAITDTRWRKEQEKAGLQRASLFNWQQTAEIVLKTYHSVL